MLVGVLALFVHVKSLLSCLTLYNLMDYIAHQPPLSMDSPGKNIGVHCHSFLQDFPDPCIQPKYLMSPALQADSLLLSHGERLFCLWLAHIFLKITVIPGLLIFPDLLGLLSPLSFTHSLPLLWLLFCAILNCTKSQFRFKIPVLIQRLLCCFSLFCFSFHLKPLERIIHKFRYPYSYLSTLDL